MMKFSNDNENTDVVEKPKMTLDNLHKGKLTASSLVNQSVEIDPFMEHSLNFKHGLEELMWQYKEVNRDIRKKINK
jgi:hypothetical protein